MEDRYSKKSSAPSDLPSPVLLRRRLSAPETIMRKHMLAQQRSNSQDSDTTQASDIRSCQWRMEREVGSDSNLSRKRDYGLMRKSTLMRRLWGSNKPLSERSSRFSGSYYDWQHVKLSQGRSTQSLGSTHSSPEHLKHRNRASLNEELGTPSVHQKQSSAARKTKVCNNLSPKNQTGESRRIYNTEVDPNSMQKWKTFNGNSHNGSLKTSCCSNCTYITSFENPSSSFNSRLSTTKTATTMSTTETESGQNSTRSTSTTGTTIFSDNSDSAYINSHSNFTQTSNENSSVCTTTYSSERYIEENGNVEENENANNYRNVEFTSPEKEQTTDSKTPNEAATHVITSRVNDSSTQTSDTTNLNVISNVQLSQSTLNLIFNQVMQDVQNCPMTNINVSTISGRIPLPSDVSDTASQHKVIEVQQIPSFYLKQKDEKTPSNEQHRVHKIMVSSVTTGSPYSKPAEIPEVVVPRFSALPRTTSMEVNISSGESTDRESDNVSLVDSLEDPRSPRVDINQNTKYDDKPVRGDLSLQLPDNSSSKFNKVEGKASSFFVPFKVDEEPDVKSVADHLPEKVRERLCKRQHKREQKLRQTKDKVISPRSDSNYVSASDNGNQLHCIVDNVKFTSSASTILPNINQSKNKRKSKSTLPNIDLPRQSKTDSKGSLRPAELDKVKEKKLSKLVKRKIVCRSQENHRENSENDKKQAHWMAKTRHKVFERLSPLYAAKNEFVYGVVPKKMYHKTELSNADKHIEILEIVECIEAVANSNSQRSSKSKKSKIPVLVNAKLPNISTDDRSQKPTFLDLDQIHEVEPKVDQLIANILIDALNKSELQNVSDETRRFATNTSRITEKRLPTTQSIQTRHQVNKYQQTFEAIPEERIPSLQSSLENASNNDAGCVNDLSQCIVAERVGEIVKELPRPGIQDKRHSNIAHNNSTNGSGITSKYAVPDGCKGKAALGIIKDENFSTIPKGWITFYTLHKSQGSLESTSDEGKKKMSINESTNCKGNLREDIKKRKQLDKIPDNDITKDGKLKNSKNTEAIHSTQQNLVSPNYTGTRTLSPKEKPLSRESLDTWSSSDQEKHTRVLHPLPPTGFVNRNLHKKERYRNVESPSKSMSGGWSVTVSGTTSVGQFAPDMEMRLTFPHGTKQNNLGSQADSSLKEDNPKGKWGNFPYLIPPKENHYTKNTLATENTCGIEQLPQIARHSSMKKSRQCASGHPVNAQDFGMIKPRHTKTTTRRLLLNRPRTFITPAEFIGIDPDNSNLKEILEKFPEILKITGNAISPEQKPRVPTMSERDVTRQIYRNS